MIVCDDGPAKGVRRNCQRSPRYLRMMEADETAERPTWDVLDQIDDVPRPDETIHVYEWVRYVDGGIVHLDGVRDGKRFGEWYGEYRSLAANHYRHVPLDDATRERLRDNAEWREWCATRAREATA